MKSLISKLLAVLLLSAQGAFTLRGMVVDANQNYLDFLGNIPAPGVLTLAERFALDKEREDKLKNDKDQKITAAMSVVPQKQVHASNMPKKVRSLLDISAMGVFARMPESVWQNHGAPCVDYGPSLFPVAINRVRERSFRGYLRMSKDQSIGVLTTQADASTVIDLKGFDVLYQRSFPRELPYPNLSNTGKFLFHRQGPAHQGSIRCFDLTAPNIDEMWQIPGGYCVCDPNDALLAVPSLEGRIHVYDMKTKKRCFETDGSYCVLKSDVSCIAVQHNDRIKIYDLSNKEHKQLFDHPGYDLYGFIGNKNIAFRNVDSPKYRIYDIESGIELMAFDDVIQNSPDGKLIVNFTDINGDVFVKIYEIASKNIIFQARSSSTSNGVFSNDSHYFIFTNADGDSMLVDLSSTKTWKLSGNEPVFSSDGRFCALRKKHEVWKESFFGNTFVECSIEVSIIDLKTKREIARYESEPISEQLYEMQYCFSADNSALHVIGCFTRDSQAGWINNIDNRLWKLDLSSFKDKKFQDALANKLTIEQSTLLMLLDEVKDKNNDAPISLLHDIARKKMLSLRELRATLASFHTLIRESIIKKYAIVDPAAESIKKATQDKIHQNKKFWMNVAKVSGVAIIMTALGAWWYLKKQ